MGITYWLISIDPEVYKEMAPKVAKIGVKDAEAARQLYRQRGRKPMEDMEESMDFFFIRDDFEGFRNNLLEELITESSWDFYKLFNDIKNVFEAFPQLTELNDFCGFGRFDIKLSLECWSCNTNLWGIWSPMVLKEFQQAMQRFDTKEKVRTFARTIKFSWPDRLRSKDKKAAQAIELWLKEDIWEIWQEMRDAVNSTLERQWYLGFCMSA